MECERVYDRQGRLSNSNGRGERYKRFKRERKGTPDECANDKQYKTGCDSPIFYNSLSPLLDAIGSP
jgi:hypothetical protein